MNTSVGLDLLLFILEILMFYYSASYVVRYAPWFIGKNAVKQSANFEFLRSIWQSEIGFALAFLTLIWLSANTLFGTDAYWLDWSATIRKIILVMSLFFILHSQINRRDLWVFNRPPKKPKE